MSKNPLNVLQSTVTKVARKFDGHITNLASGVTSSVSSIADTVQMDRKHSRHHAPDILEASSFVRKPGTPNAETPSGSLAHESSTTDVEYVADAQQNAKPWWQEPGCDYLCVTVRRARNLAIMDYEAKSSHSSVKVTLGGKGASVHYDEHTRTVSRSRHPMWQQSFFFPMASLNMSTPVNMIVRHSSILMHREDFMGQVSTNVAHLLQHVAQSKEPFTRWYRLTGRKPTEKVVGDLEFSITVLPREIFIQAMPHTRNLFNREILIRRYHDLTLQITLHGLKDIKMIGKVYENAESSLTITFKIGHCCVTEPLQHEGGDAWSAEGMSFKLSDKILLPLVNAFDGKPPKKPEQGADVKVYIKFGKEILCRTQVPIWDVPHYSEEDDADADEDSLPTTEGDGERASPPSQLSSQVSLPTKLTSESSSGLSTQNPKKKKNILMGAVDVVSVPAKFVVDIAKPGAKVDSSDALARVSCPRQQASSDEAMEFFQTHDLNPLDCLIPALNTVVGPLGRQYKRAMDAGNLASQPEINFSLYIVPKQDAAAPAIIVGYEDDDEDSEPIDPISPPTPLDVEAVSIFIPGKPTAVFTALTDADSPFLKGVMSAEALRDNKIHAWESAPSVGANALTRKVTYVRPLNIPLAPKQCDVEEVHTVKVKELGGFVLERKVSTNAPKGDAFYVLIREAGVWDPVSKSTKFSSSFQIEITKSLGFLKGVVMNGATSSTKHGANVWASELAKHMAAHVGGGKKAGGVSSPAGTTACRDLASSAGGGSLPMGFSIPDKKTICLVVQMLSWVMMTVGILNLGFGIAGIARGLAQLISVYEEKGFKILSGETYSQLLLAATAAATAGENAECIDTDGSQE